VVNSVVSALRALVQPTHVLPPLLACRRHSWRRACALLSGAALVVWGCQPESEPGSVGGSCNDDGGEECVAGAVYLAPDGVPTCHARCRIGCNDCGRDEGECIPWVDRQTNEQKLACQFTQDSPSSIRPGQIGEFCNRNEGVASCVSGGVCVNDVCRVQCTSDADCGGEAGVCIDNSARRLPSYCERAALPPNWRQPRPECQASPSSAGGSGGPPLAGCRELLRRQQQVDCRSMPGSVPITPTACPSSPTDAAGAKPPVFTCGDPCIRDTYVDAALQYCWAAECYANFEMAAQSASAVESAKAELVKAFMLCSNAPVLGTPIRCPTREIVDCTPSDMTILDR
jgi:hypothetical protein